MTNLLDLIKKYQSQKKAIGHFNFAESSVFKAILECSRELSVPIILGTSEGERDFLSVSQAVAWVKAARHAGYEVFLNADHTKSFDKAVEAINAGYDAVLFDGGHLPLEENIKITKRVVEYAKATNPNIVIEGELGYIGNSSKLLKELPEGVAVLANQLTKALEAKHFVEATGVDMLAPAVGNIHGMLIHAKEPDLNIGRIKEIKELVSIPLVLHGASGNSDSDIQRAVHAGVSIVHINTEIRLAWRNALDAALLKDTDEISPYKLLEAPIAEVKRVIRHKLSLYSK